MKTVQKIIELHGGLAALDPAGPGYINIKNEPYMRLVIEHVGAGPGRKLPLISVAHYGEQNGDAMRDPEMTFEVDFEGWAKSAAEYEESEKARGESEASAKGVSFKQWIKECKASGRLSGAEARLFKSLKPKLDDFWHPVSFRNDYVGVCQEGDDGAVFRDAEGKLLVRPKLIRELRSFARTWDRNIKEQGFVEAYLRARKENENTGKREAEEPSTRFPAHPSSTWRQAFRIS